MLYHKLRTLPSTCIFLATKSSSGVIFQLIKKYVSCSRHMQSSQNVKEWPQDVVIKFDEVEGLNKISSVYEKYIQHVNPTFRNKILQNYMSLNINGSDPYLISREIGKDFVTLIKDDLLDCMSHIVELNPGFGVLTENLLQAGIPFIDLYENNREFYPELHILSTKYPNRFNVRKANLFKISKLLNLGNNGTSEVNICRILNNLPQKKWEEDSCMQLIGTTTKHLFIRHLIISTVFQTGFMMYGRPIFYLAVSPSVWTKYTCRSSTRSAPNVMFNILFNYKTFGTIDRKAFVPWQQSRRKTKTYKNSLLQDDNNLLVVVKIEPKRNLFSLFNGKKDLVHFWHFVRHQLYRPTQRIIPALEAMIPGCGVRLIEKDYTIYTEFGCLSHSQLYDLYTQLKSWPEFNESIFLISATEVKTTFDPYRDEEYDE